MKSKTKNFIGILVSILIIAFVMLVLEISNRYSMSLGITGGLFAVSVILPMFFYEKILRIKPAEEQL